MYYTITPQHMRSLEREFMEKCGVSSETLMYRAASHVADAVVPYLTTANAMVTCFCGTGNNGADALCAMRILCERGYAFQCNLHVLSGVPTEDFLREKQRLLSMMDVQWGAPITQSTLIVDALFGTGLSRPLQGEALLYVQKINKEKEIPVLSVDIPSGLHGETGQVMGEAVQATQTICFQQCKQGLLLGDGIDVAGEVKVVDIGLPLAPDGRVLEKEDIDQLLPKRKRNTHKGHYGKVLLFAGSVGMAGAAALAGLATLKTGAGLVRIACPERIVDVVQVLCPCATCLPLPTDEKEAIPLLCSAVNEADAVVMGCGIGRSEWAKHVVHALLAHLQENPRPYVMDADALNLWTAEQPLPSGGLITPHPMEASRLLNVKVGEIINNPTYWAKVLHEKMGVGVVLKGACSVLYAQDGWGINPFGTPAMAKGGSGDVLSGIMGALLAANGRYLRLTDIALLQLGCALHGLAGEKTSKITGERAMLATDYV